MDQSYKPQGYSSVSAYVVANGAQRVTDFLIEAFAARQIHRYDRPDGSIMHAEVQIDDTIVMIADGGGDNPAFPVWLHVYVPAVSPSMSRNKGKAIPTVAPGSKTRQAILGGSLPRSAETMFAYVL